MAAKADAEHFARVGFDRMPTIRPFRAADLATLESMTVEGFDGVSIDQNIERRMGSINGHDWRWRKARHVADDARRDPDGIFVAELEGRVVGYVSTWRDPDAGVGFIPNIVVSSEVRGRGLGRRLLEHALAHFRASGLRVARIETLDQNPVGQHLYPSLGFVEVARQIHYALPLRDDMDA